MVDSSYTPIPGSEHLRTRKFGGRDEIDRLEQMEPGVRFAERVGEATLARCTIRSAYVPMLLDVFDRLAPRQSAMEQATYHQLWRLALADERNFCRVSRRDLQARLQLSDRRLGKALAGLAGKGHIVLVDRDRRGTLYQVRFPHEILGEMMGDELLMKQPPQAATPSRDTGAPRAPRTDLSSVAPRAVDDRSSANADEPGLADPAPASAAARPPIRSDDSAPTESARPFVNVSPVDADPMTAGPASPVEDAKSSAAKPTVGSVVAAFFAEVNQRSDKPQPQLVIEAVFDLRERGHTLSVIQAALLRFAKEAPRQTPVAELSRFVNPDDDA